MEKGEGDSSIFLLYARVLTCSFQFNLQSKFVEREATDLLQALTFCNDIKTLMENARHNIEV